MNSYVPNSARFVVVSGQEVVIPEHTKAVFLDTDRCTLKEYARRTGLSYSGVKKLADQGVIETIKTGDPSSSGARFVNLIKMAEKSLDH